MRSHRVFPVCLLSAGVLVLAACATSQPRGALLEKKFQQTAKYYDKYQHEGQLVYCKRGATRSMPPVDCITESALRLQVENYQRTRNPMERGGPPYVDSVPGG